MRANEKNRLQMFRRVRDLLRARPEAPELELNLKRLEGVIDRLTEEAARQAHMARLSQVGTKRKEALSRELRSELFRPIIRVGLSFLPSSGPEGESIRRSMRMPRVRDVEGVLTVADDLARLVASHVVQFEALGLSKGHTTRLLERAAELRASVDSRGHDVARRSNATKAVQQLVRDGMQQVRILESLLEPQFRLDEAVRAGWRSARVVARAGGGVDPTFDADAPRARRGRGAHRGR